jgi:hypothetical protein
VDDLVVMAPWYFAVVPFLAMANALLRAVFDSQMSPGLQDLVLSLEVGERCFAMEVVLRTGNCQSRDFGCVRSSKLKSRYEQQRMRRTEKICGGDVPSNWS